MNAKFEVSVFKDEDTLYEGEFLGSARLTSVFNSCKVRENRR
jgi:hypothetical protein